MSANEFVEAVMNGSITARLIRTGANSDLAEDAVQEAFAAVMPRLSKIDNPWSYMLRVARQKYWDLVLGDAHENQMPIDELPAEIQDPGSNPLELAIAREQREQLNEAVTRIENPTRRQVVELMQKGMSTKEIAEKLHITEKYVRVHKYRASRELTKMLRIAQGALKH